MSDKGWLILSILWIVLSLLMFLIKNTEMGVIWLCAGVFGLVTSLIRRIQHRSL